MGTGKRTSRALIGSALLHLGLIGFLLLTTLSCTSWERAADFLHLPRGWNPVTCKRPMSLKGPVIQATLVGTSAAPLPPVTHQAEKPEVPPLQQSKPEIAAHEPEVPKLETLPPPPKHPDVKNQQEVVARAPEKAEKAKREQEQKHKQQMAELEAQKRQQQIDKLLEQMNQTHKSSEQARHQSELAKQKLAQLKDLAKAESKAAVQPEGVEQAEQAHTGGNGTAEDAYKAAIQNAVTHAWLRPDNIPEGAVCPIHIVQIPGGQVVSVTIDSSCPFDSAARRSVKNAVLRAQPLPYKGYEKAFRSNLTLHFKVED